MGKRPRHLIKEDTQIANRHVKRCSSSYLIKEIQIKTIMTYHYTFIRMAKIWNTKNTKCWHGYGAMKLSFIAGGNEKWYHHFGRQFGIFLQNKTIYTFTI